MPAPSRTSRGFFPTIPLTICSTPAVPTPAAATPAHADTTVALAGSAAVLPFSNAGVLPARPNLPDDPTIPHNGFATFEEGEKAFMHLLRKAGVDADWTWDQTMRTIITDPLYKALNSLAEKKATWQKVRFPLSWYCLLFTWFLSQRA